MAENIFICNNLRAPFAVLGGNLPIDVSKHLELVILAKVLHLAPYFEVHTLGPADDLLCISGSQCIQVLVHGVVPAVINSGHHTLLAWGQVCAGLLLYNPVREQLLLRSVAALYWEVELSLYDDPAIDAQVGDLAMAHHTLCLQLKAAHVTQYVSARQNLYVAGQVIPAIAAPQAVFKKAALVRSDVTL